MDRFAKTEKAMDGWQLNTGLLLTKTAGFGAMPKKPNQTPPSLYSASGFYSYKTGANSGFCSMAIQEISPTAEPFLKMKTESKAPSCIRSRELVPIHAGVSYPAAKARSDQCRGEIPSG